MSVVSLTVVLALIAVREGLRYHLFVELERELSEENQVALLAIQDFHPDRLAIEEELQRIASGHKQRNWYVRWVESDRMTVIWATENAPVEPPNTLIHQTTDFQVWGSGQFRYVEHPVILRGKVNSYLRIGAPIDYINNDVARLTNIIMPVAVVILCLAPLGGYLLATRSIEPLQAIIRRTEQLRPDYLQERLPLRGVGDELDQLASKINQFLDQIAAYLRKNRDFLANAAHELRSPLAAIQSSVEVAMQRPRQASEYEELLYSISDECHHLSSLVNQLMLLVESESGLASPPRQVVVLSDLVRRAVEMFGPVAEEQGVTLQQTGDPEVLVNGDWSQLKQVITNLVDNAIKFTPRGGSIVVDVSNDGDNSCLLRVSDTGSGIPPEDQLRIFERFYQVDRARTRGQERRGNGLGLSICAAIVKMHGGTITVESELLRGTTFTIRLPKTEESPTIVEPQGVG